MADERAAGARSSGADWYLGDADEQHRLHPRSFFIPTRSERESLEQGSTIRLLFLLRNAREDQPRAERMWLDVIAASRGQYVGVLDNQPIAIEDLKAGDLVGFGPEHVIAIQDARWAPYENKLAFASRRLVESDALVPGSVRHDPDDEQRPPRADGSRLSGWQLLVGDETEDEVSDAANVCVSNLGWLMERYPSFAELVFSGARAGGWVLDRAIGRYRAE